MRKNLMTPITRNISKIDKLGTLKFICCKINYCNLIVLFDRRAWDKVPHRLLNLSKEIFNILDNSEHQDGWNVLEVMLLLPAA